MHGKAKLRAVPGSVSMARRRLLESSPIAVKAGTLPLALDVRLMAEPIPAGLSAAQSKGIRKPMTTESGSWPTGRRTGVNTSIFLLEQGETRSMTGRRDLAVR